MIRIQKLGHIGLNCRDVEKMNRFYTDTLGFRVSDVNERGMVFLRFGTDHHTLVLAPLSEEEKKKGEGFNPLQHIAFEVADLNELKRIKKYLEQSGVRVLGKIRHEGPGGNYVVNFLDPEGNMLQFFSDMDQIGWDGMSRPKEHWKRFDVHD